MNQSENINELAAALSKAQNQMGSANKDAENPFFKSNYATLLSLKEASIKALFDNGLSVSQITIIHESKPYLKTLLLHSSGQWLSSLDPILTKDGSPQAYGSGKKYAMRYGYEAIVGIATADSEDDGNKAQHGAQEIKPDIQNVKAPTSNKKPGCISDKQAIRLIGIATRAGYTEAQVIEYVIKQYRVNNLLDLPWKEYESVVTAFTRPAPKQPSFEDINFNEGDFIA